MNDEHERRVRAAEIRREIQKRRAARATGCHGKKMAVDFFEQVKAKMVMRIYGVSCKRAKEIIAGRMAERVALETENEANREKRARNFRRRVRDDDNDEWLPVGEIIVGDEA